MDKCPICNSPLIGYDDNNVDPIIVNCYRCGKFKITEEAIMFQCRHLGVKQLITTSKKENMSF